MKTATTTTYGIQGIRARRVGVDAHISGGLPAFNIVGLAETIVRESRERVRSAIINSGFDFPAKRITLNLSPADLPKQGGGYDLPIALAILIASGQIRSPEQPLAFWGELSLDGECRPSRGLFPLLIQAEQDELRLIHPPTAEADHQLVSNDCHLALSHLRDVCSLIERKLNLAEVKPRRLPAQTTNKPSGDLREVRGQTEAKAAMEIAAAGGHNILLVGSPGSGKSMLAQRMPGLLPQLALEDAREVASIHSVCNLARASFEPPIRMPHHTASAAALVGGGAPPAPGEITLAHRGVLFLDEFPEFAPKVLQALREPLENGEISVSRASGRQVYPANFQLVAAMNPCPCGYAGTDRCECSRDQINRYQRRISGPLLDRIDLWVAVRSQPTLEVMSRQLPAGPSTAEVRQRVEKARQLQISRQGCINARLSAEALDSICKMDEQMRSQVGTAADKLGLSLRGLHRMLRVALTIADLKQEPLAMTHLFTALGYRDTQGMLS